MSAPTPATVWTAGGAPIDLDSVWPAALVERIVTSFSTPTDRVVLLAWPHPRRADGVIPDPPRTMVGSELADIVTAVERLDRTAHVEHLPITSTGPASHPFWADHIAGVGSTPVTVPTAPEVTVEMPVPDAVTELVGSADLIVTSLPPSDSGGSGFGNVADIVALYAARQLRVGGILAVLTHCDWTLGELVDPTGAVVTAGQDADLLYLQHIAALHTPVRDGQFHHPDSDSDGVHADHHTDDGHTRSRQRALARGLPAPHRRIHSDVLVFAQPHNHKPTHRQSANARTDTDSRNKDIR